MDFRRIQGLPPYVFTIIDGLKVEARRAGRDVVDLGFGNPDLPSPQIAVDKLAEAAHNTRNHRYSSSRGIPKLREAVAALYQRRFGVTLDPEREIISTIGAKEGFSHLMWVLLQPGDTAIVPTPSYPTHTWGPDFAGASTPPGPAGAGDDGAGYIDRVIEAWESGTPKPRVVVLSFPHNPTTTTVELADLQRLVNWARERDVALVHDLAYADMCFAGWEPPSIMQSEGATEVAVALSSLTKSFSMAGWRVAFMVGRTDVIAALTQLKSYLDYGTFQPIQIAATVTLNEAQDYPAELSTVYESRRNALVDGLARAGWEIHRPRGTMFAWARIPEPYKEMGSIEFATHLIRECDVAVSPGVGFGTGGDEFVRFALIENEHRIGQATRAIKRGLIRLQG